jgi:hypothetical protein
LKKFRKAARELECDESELNFDAALKAVVKHAPAKDKRPSKKQGVARLAIASMLALGL